MKPFCEMISVDILPTARALVAHKLITEFGLTQRQAAERMGMSQPAISQYKRQLRGVKKTVFEESPELQAMVNELAKRLATGQASGTDSTLLFCTMCKAIRFHGRGCELHRRMDPSLQSCNVCLQNAEFYGEGKSTDVKNTKEKSLDSFGPQGKQ